MAVRAHVLLLRPRQRSAYSELTDARTSLLSNLSSALYNFHPVMILESRRFGSFGLSLRIVNRYAPENNTLAMASIR